jgi:cytosine/adenosine deaminase-related metal-dependent hydrolase
MTTYRAEWILPIVDSPIRGGWLTVDHGRIVALGDGDAPGTAADLGRVVLLPALVNAHTHLELSYLGGRVPPAEQFLEWIRGVKRTRRQYPDAGDPEILRAAAAALADARATGTGLVGDVSNTLVTVPLLREAGMPAHVFYELLGFSEPDPESRVHTARALVENAGTAGDVRISLAPHAPYSVSADLFRAIRTDLDAHRPRVTTVHLGESSEEIELLSRGTGPWKGLLQELAVWNDSWRAPRLSPVGYLQELGFLDGDVLVVHAVQLEGEDLSRLSALQATVVSCPRSNRYVGVGSPPIDAFYAMDVRVAFGTDSLASAPDLNMFAELAEARRAAPRVPARRLLESATRVGAEALGFGAEFGSLEPGRRAAVLAVQVPGEVKDVEEYLVSGVPREAIRWLDPAATGGGPDTRSDAP